jgi:hypothetical protein
VDACPNKTLLRIGQVAFFKSWKIEVQDYCSLSDYEEALKGMDAELGFLMKLVEAQNQAYGFRVATLLLNYVVDVVADGKL